MKRMFHDFPIGQGLLSKSLYTLGIQSYLLRYGDVFDTVDVEGPVVPNLRFGRYDWIPRDMRFCFLFDSTGPRCGSPRLWIDAVRFSRHLRVLRLVGSAFVLVWESECRTSGHRTVAPQNTKERVEIEATYPHVSRTKLV